MRVPEPTQLYQHFKGDFYLIMGVGRHTETGEWMVCFREASAGVYWFRPLSMWNEEVEYEGKMIPRFKLITVNI